MGHDQWAVFFNKYQVLGSRLKILCQTEATNAGNVRLCTLPTTDPAQSGIYDMAEQNLGREKMITSLVTHPTTISRFYSTKKMLGTPGPITVLDASTSQMGANPLAQWYWVIATAGTVADTTSVSFDVEIVYYVRMFNRVDLPRS